MNRRKTKVTRKTRETSIAVALDLDGTGSYSIKTGLPFLDHMLDLFSRHSLIDLRVKAEGDLAVDYHHTVEDIGLCMGTAVHRALGGREGITRYGFAAIPMDDALSEAVVDLGGRPFLVMEVANRSKRILDFDLGLVEEFFRAFCAEARMNLHLRQKYGKEPHHAYESLFKAWARAMRQAVALDAREKGVPSSKGSI
ncbi:MAG: imidazoleglycerol-phosphate dehydratase HisB [Lentisphaerae bacterium]|mgnify:CR=1 FL=1|nr:imidazoleglycerol-phosphate dehydratase HisB [Lentisphaerota bacterium]